MKNQKRKVTQTNIVETVDIRTGEIELNTVQSQSFLIDREPDYVKLYLADVTRLKDIPAGMNKVLFELMKSINYNGIIMAYKPVKDLMCLNMGISVNYLNKCIDEFHRKGILIRYARGVYIADPNLFAKGSWKDIQNLRLVIEYNIDGTKTLKSNVSDEMKAQLKMDF
jgi:hypothetical protein